MRFYVIEAAGATMLCSLFSIPCPLGSFHFPNRNLLNVEWQGKDFLLLFFFFNWEFYCT